MTLPTVPWSFQPEERPDLTALKDRLRALGGPDFPVDEVLGFSIGPDLCHELLTEGKQFDWKDARFVTGGQPKGCHINTLTMARLMPGSEPYVGLALASVGIWVPHWWLLDVDGQFIELTQPYVRYFGVPGYDEITRWVQHLADMQRWLTGIQDLMDRGGP
jgi:hypothetical protein